MAVPAVAVVADSAAALDPALAGELGIVTVPMQLEVGGVSRSEADMPLDELVRHLDDGVQTSAPPPGAFVDASAGGGVTTTERRGFRPPAGGSAGASASISAGGPASTPGVIWAWSLPFFGVTRTMTSPAPPAYSKVAPVPLPIRSAASLGAISVSRA